MKNDVKQLMFNNFLRTVLDDVLTIATKEKINFDNNDGLKKLDDVERMLKEFFTNERKNAYFEEFMRINQAIEEEESPLCCPR